MQTEKNPFVNYEVKRQSSVKTNSSLNNKFLMHHWYSLINVSHQMLHDSCWRRTSSYLVWLNSTTNHNSVPNEDANLKPWYLNKMPNEEEKKNWLQSIPQIHLKSANASNPRKGLQIIWQRLEDRFRSPKLIETFSKTKLFPPIKNKELISIHVWSIGRYYHTICKKHGQTQLWNTPINKTRYVLHLTCLFEFF